MDLTKYCKNQEYEFEILPEDLGYFQRRALLREKLQEKSENCLFFVQKNKVLSVEIQDGQKTWLQYEKAIFFYSVFSINKKYALISENDSFFYGYIDGFPCVFKDSFDDAITILMDYSEGEEVFIYGIGNVSVECCDKKSLYDVSRLMGSDSVLKTEEVSSLLMEDTSEYSDSIFSKKVLSLFFLWKKKKEERSCKAIRRSFFFFLGGVIFIFLSFLLK